MSMYVYGFTEQTTLLVFWYSYLSALFDLDYLMLLCYGKSLLCDCTPRNTNNFFDVYGTRDSFKWVNYT